MSLYDYSLKKGNGEEISLEKYRGKVLLIVNTATHCGFTPQFKDLEALYQRYHDKGLEIVDVPSNQFNRQAPESDEEIDEFCSLNFGTTYERFAKTEVNGDHQEALFAFLKSQQGFKGFGEGAVAERIGKIVESYDSDWRNNSDIKWNFTKFIVDREGNVVARFEPMFPLEDVEAKIKELL